MKVLIFKNEEEIKQIIRGALTGDFPPIDQFNDLLSALMDHTLPNPVMFEAEVDSHWHIPAIELSPEFEPTKKVQVIVAKLPEKPK